MVAKFWPWSVSGGANWSVALNVFPAMVVVWTMTGATVASTMAAVAAAAMSAAWMRAIMFNPKPVKCL